MAIDKLKEIINSLSDGKISEQQIAEMKQLINELSGKETSEEKEVTETLKKSELFYRELFELTNDVVFTMDFEGNFTSINPMAEKIVGRKLEEVSERNVKKYLTPKSAKAVGKNIYRKLYEGEPQSQYEAEFINEDNSITTFYVNSFIRYKDDKPYEIFGVARNISEYKKTEKALRESEEKYRLIIENISDIIYTYNLNGLVTFVSPNVEVLSGYKPEEIVGQSMVSFVYPEDVELVISDVEKTIETKQGVSTICRLVKKDGTLIYIEENGKVILDEKDEIVFITGIIRDIGERRRAEEQLKGALQEKVVLLKEIHHRVKNNMQVIISLINMHIPDITDEQMLKRYKELQDRVRTMSLVHEDLYMSENLSQIEFAAYTKKLTSNLFTAYGGNGKVCCRLNISDILLDIDTAIPCGIIINELVSNSLKYAFSLDKIEHSSSIPQHEIHIEFHADNDNYILLVRDNGIGLPADFDLQSSRTMGLRLVNILVNDQLNGTINMNSNSGTEFLITFGKRK